VGELARELSHLDTRTLRSLRGLARPGLLTAEYLANRRRRYSAPLKLYFVCAALFFLAAPFIGFDLDSVLRQDSTGLLKQLTEQRMAAKQLSADLFEARFDLRLQTVYTLGLAVSVAATALFLSGLFLRQRRLFAAHLVFAVHYVSFLYLAAVGLGALTRVAQIPPIYTLPLAYMVIAPYLFLALRRVYGESRGRSLWKTMVLLTVTLIVDTIVNLSAVLITMMLV